MNWVVAVPSALASAVEFVEAFTIVLAVGVTRGWKSAWVGTGIATLTLALLVAVLGVTVLQKAPLNVLQTVVGALLLLFGLKWLRKAILRYSGLKALHDEAETFKEEVAVLGATGSPLSGIDRVGALTAFNGVFLEGLEVVFIVIALGAGYKTAGSTGAAAVGAIVAGLVVAAVGFAVRKPLERVPENTLKFVVGIMLTSFGTFFTGEGLGVDWWNNDWSILPLIAGYLLVSWALIGWLKRESGAPASASAIPKPQSL